MFYRTLPMVDDPILGSDVRPAKLLSAFRQLGYDVDVVAGPAGERRRAIEDVRRKISAGVRYEFLYAEPPTTPIPLNEPHHFPTHPLLDYQFLALCHSRRVPVILFYCDVQWRLPGYRGRIGWAKYLAVLPFFHLDLFVYGKVVDALLVPDRGYIRALQSASGMLPPVARWASVRPNWVSTPGFDPMETLPAARPVAEDAPLRFFYVGGVTPPFYDLTPLLAGSAWAAGRGLKHELTICCPEADWRRRPETYDRHLGPHVTVVHNRNRAELLELYSRHDIAVMPYGTLHSEWTMPVKFPEAVGMGLPVLAGAGTAVAEAAAEQGIGWSVGPSPEDLGTVLAKVDRTELERVRATVARVRPQFTWAERAREVEVIAAEVRGAQRDGVPHPG